MSERDRQILVVGGIVAGLILLHLLVIRPFSIRVADLEQSLQTRQTQVADMRELAEEVSQLRAQLPQGADNLNLLSYLEGLARQEDLNSKIDYMSSGPGVVRGNVRLESVELRMNRLNLQEITTLLFQIEHGGRYPLRIEQINIRKRFDNPELIDVTLEIYQG